MDNNNYKYIKSLIKFIYENYNNINYEEITKNIKNQLLNLNINFNSNDLIIILNLLYDYKINKYDYKLFKDIIKKYNIYIIENYNKYELLIHKYIYLIIYYYNKEDKEIKKELDNFINELKDNNILNEFYKINNYMKKYNLIKLFQNPEIIYFNNNIIDNNIINKITINNKIDYPFITTQYYDYDIFITYQCFIKSSINFFINNKNFYNQFINNNISLYNKPIDKFILNENNNNINSEIIDTLNEIESKNSKDIYINNIKQNGGNKLEIYNLFINMINNINNDNIIKNYYIEFKRLLNNNLNNKYLLGIPGFKIYSFYVIQDILFLLNDNFCNNSIIEYDNKTTLSYIYYCNKNYFLHDILELHQLQQLDKKYNITYLDYNFLKEKNNNYYNNPYKIYINNEVQYSKLLKLPFQFINNKYHYQNNIINYIKHIKNNPINLLIACPIHDITSLYMLNNKMKLFTYNYIKLKSINKFIKNKYNINIIYPFIIKLNQFNYKLHSFIIVINNGSLDNHFVYYKLDNNDLLRFDTEKLRINNNNLNKFSTDYKYVIDEYKQLYHNNCIIDNLYYKVIFCYYRKINK